MLDVANNPSPVTLERLSNDGTIWPYSPAVKVNPHSLLKPRLNSQYQTSPRACTRLARCNEQDELRSHLNLLVCVTLNRPVMCDVISGFARGWPEVSRWSWQMTRAQKASFHHHCQASYLIQINAIGQKRHRRQPIWPKHFSLTFPILLSLWSFLYRRYLFGHRLNLVV